MGVKLNQRQVGEVSVIEVIGRITLGEGSSAVRDAVNNAVISNHKKILLHLGEVPYVDSSGIGELVSAYSVVTKNGGQFKLTNPTKRVRDLLRISRHDMLFDIHEEEAGALQSFT